MEEQALRVSGVSITFVPTHPSLEQGHLLALVYLPNHTSPEHHMTDGALCCPFGIPRGKHHDPADDLDVHLAKVPP